MTSIRARARTALRFPPLPTHLIRDSDGVTTGSSDDSHSSTCVGTQAYCLWYASPAEDGISVSIAHSAVSGTMTTGAVVDTKPLPKLVVDGAHDRQDAFI